MSYYQLMQFLLPAVLLIGCSRASLDKEASLLDTYIRTQRSTEAASQDLIKFCESQQKVLKVKTNGILGCMPPDKAQEAKK